MKNKNKLGHFVKGNIPWNKGKEIGSFTEEHRTKISESLKGKNKGNPGFWKGKKRPNLWSEESREKQSKSQKMLYQQEKGNGFKSGEDHPYFNNWSSRKPYGKEFSPKFKEEIRKHFHYRCQQCFRHQDELGRKLDVHHIDFDKQNNNFMNLIPLCNTCHSQTQFNRGNWIEYFKQKVTQSQS